MTAIAKKRIQSRIARHERVRKSVVGTAECPRLAVRRSLSNKSVAQVTTASKEFQGKFGEMTKTEQAKQLGLQIAELAKSKGIESVVFDRGGYIYHGRVQALAEGAREGGLKF